MSFLPVFFLYHLLYYTAWKMWRSSTFFYSAGGRERESGGGWVGITIGRVPPFHITLSHLQNLPSFFFSTSPPMACEIISRLIFFFLPDQTAVTWIVLACLIFFLHVWEKKRWSYYEALNKLLCFIYVRDAHCADERTRACLVGLLPPQLSSQPLSSGRPFPSPCGKRQQKKGLLPPFSSCRRRFYLSQTKFFIPFIWDSHLS